MIVESCCVVLFWVEGRFDDGHMTPLFKLAYFILACLFIMMLYWFCIICSQFS